MEAVTGAPCHHAEFSSAVWRLVFLLLVLLFLETHRRTMRCRLGRWLGERLEVYSTNRCTVTSLYGVMEFAVAIV